MDYAQIHFGKPLGQITYEDVETFFSTERDETDQLEFKSFPATATLDAMVTTLSQGITSFLNSSGGMLIWGAPEGRRVDGRSEKVFVGALTKVPLTVAKDWLISKVSDKIIPLPNGVRVQLIPTADSQVCVFEVDESPSSPHQTGGTYYMRLDGQKKPAPHHYVEALFKKITFPQVEAYITPVSIFNRGNEYDIEIRFVFMNFSPFENEEEFTYRLTFFGGEFKNAMEPNIPNTLRQGYSMSGSRFTNSNSTYTLFYGEPRSENRVITVRPHLLTSTSGIASLFINFGGKKSPMKMSEYKIDFNNVANVRHDDAALLFQIKHENKLLSDLQAEIGTTKETLLQTLGVLRPPTQD